MFRLIKRAHSTAGGSSADPVVFVAMLALGEPVLPDADAMQSLLRLQWNDKPRFSSFVLKNGVLTGEIGKAVCAVALVNSPIPEGDIEAALADTSEGKAVSASIKSHSFHLICSVAGPISKTEAANALTKLAAVASDFGDCRAVYWGAAPMIHLPEEFKWAARNMTREILPLRLWVRFEAGMEAGRTSLRTQGMASFGFMEIEIIASERSPKEVEGLAFNFAHYLLDHGAVIKDGNTFGLSATDKTRVRHLPSVIDPQRTVYRLEY